MGWVLSATAVDTLTKEKKKQQWKGGDAQKGRQSEPKVT